MLSADQEWLHFLSDDTLKDNNIVASKNDSFIPKVTPIYISTQTKIGFLNQTINLNEVFWEIPVLPYQSTKAGVIKKQMKINCDTKEQTDKLEEKIKHESMISINQIKLVDNPNARKIKYKDVRKINIGLCKKDLISYRKKAKGAFYNCFVVILRIPFKQKFKEVHIKVFNTGKLEIPGIQTDEFLYIALDTLISILSPYCNTALAYKDDDIDTVLINSNFTCNYYIDRDKLSSILKYKYKLHVNFDPCSYPGIQVKFYYNQNKIKQNGVCTCSNRCTKKGSGKGENQCLEVSFMIFRTGSILIVGHCDTNILNKVYDFLSDILLQDYNDFKINGKDNIKKPPKGKKKLRKKLVIMETKASL